MTEDDDMAMGLPTAMQELPRNYKCYKGCNIDADVLFRVAVKTPKGWELGWACHIHSKAVIG